jgi:hypothetical protein
MRTLGNTNWIIVSTAPPGVEKKASGVDTTPLALFAWTASRDIVPATMFCEAVCDFTDACRLLHKLPSLLK